jgi:hypothetical protein
MGGTSRNGGFLVDFQPISPEELQRAMQFLLNQQAQFAADIARNEARLTEGFGRVNEGLVGLTAIVGQLAAAQLRTDEQLRTTQERMDTLGQRVDDVGQYIQTVESHLNVVIQMFPQHLREDHGRRPS